LCDGDTSFHIEKLTEKLSAFVLFIVPSFPKVKSGDRWDGRLVGKSKTISMIREHQGRLDREGLLDYKYCGDSGIRANTSSILFYIEKYIAKSLACLFRLSRWCDCSIRAAFHLESRRGVNLR
jgi:hypothetical protein